MTNSPYYFVDGGMRYMLEVIRVMFHIAKLPFPSHDKRFVSLHIIIDYLDGVPFLYSCFLEEARQIFY